MGFLAEFGVGLLAQEDAANGGGIGGILGNPMVPLVIIGVMFYFLLIRPEQRRKNEHQRMLDGIKKNDRVITAGGIYGVVVNVGKEDITLRVDESGNTRMRFQRSAITRILTADDDKSSDSK